ncbi:MAG: peptidylprolyl isomerase [Muribaculaceae bacterium]|nr:peptidylprolyl isomerase [Muribaculaceae bacterium]
MNIKNLIASLSLFMVVGSATAQNNIAEEVAWVIGDEPIYKSDIEKAYQEYIHDGERIKGDPYCVIPEQLAINRLFLNQAEIDTVEVQESMVQMQADQQMNYLMSELGSREKVEQYFRQPYSQIRESFTTKFRDRSRIGQVRSSLVKNVKITPSDVRRYYETLSKDSIPQVPLQVEVQIVSIKPLIPREEIDNVKARLRDFTDRINRGESAFSSLAILYSESPGDAVRGGELGFMGRGELVPEYAAVAFNLNDTKKVSKIVETEYGFHIIQLIEKRGDRINTRQILLRPKVAEKDLADALTRLDSIRSDIADKKFTFEEAARFISQDKDTRYSRGVMVNNDQRSENYGTTFFQMGELPQEIAREVANLQPGEMSQAFVMKDPKRDQDIVAIVKLTNRVDAHTANLADDFQLIKAMYQNDLESKIVAKWLDNKIKETYVRIEDGWRGCDFEHTGWIKAKNGEDLTNVK